MSVFEKIIALADGMQDELVSQRRDFHKHAESGWFEMRTSSIIARKLTDLGYEVLVGEDVCDREARMGVPSEEALAEHFATHQYISARNYATLCHCSESTARRPN